MAKSTPIKMVRTPYLITGKCLFLFSALVIVQTIALCGEMP